MRRLNKFDPLRQINPLYTVGQLGDHTMGFTRHTIRRSIRPDESVDYLKGSRLRLGASDYFFVLCRQILPQIEDRVEHMLLDKFKDKLTSEKEKKEVETAWYQRKDNLAKIQERPLPDDKSKPAPEVAFPHSNMLQTITNLNGDGLKYHTYSDIGRYTVFPENKIKRMFPSKMYGRYREEEYEKTGNFGIQTREEGLRIANDLARLTLPHERKINYSQIARMKGPDIVYDILQDEVAYVAIFQDFSGSLLDYINNQKTDEDQIEVRDFFNAPGVFDGLVSVLIQELRCSPIRPHLCDKDARIKVMDQIVRIFMNEANKTGYRFHDMADLMEHNPCLQLLLEKSDLSSHFQDCQNKEVIKYKIYNQGYQKKCKHHWRPLDMRKVGLGEGAFKGFNTGGLIWGERGCGKSQVLSYLTAWAHEQTNWINFTIPQCQEYVNLSHDTDRMRNGLYLQHTLAQRLLNDLKIQNEQIFRDFKVDMSKYGKYDITGFHDINGEPCPRTWDPLRQCWSDDWKSYLYDTELKTINQRFDEIDYRVADKCPDPKTLMDIIAVAEEDPILATNAIAEILEQCMHTDKYHTLFTLDAYNFWLQPSEYASFRYKNDPTLNGAIPPKDLALVRMFMKFDGHMMRNGVKYLSTSHYKTFNHIMTPDMIDWFDGYDHRIPNLTLDEFRNHIQYRNLTNKGLAIPPYKEYQIERLYMESQGNYSALEASITQYGEDTYNISDFNNEQMYDGYDQEN